MKFRDDISNGRTQKPKPICSPLFQGGKKEATPFSPIITYGRYPLPWKPEFWSDQAQNLMKPFPLPNDASDKFDCDQPAGLRDIVF